VCVLLLYSKQLTPSFRFCLSLSFPYPSLLLFSLCLCVCACVQSRLVSPYPLSTPPPPPPPLCLCKITPSTCSADVQHRACGAPVGVDQFCRQLTPGNAGTRSCSFLTINLTAATLQRTLLSTLHRMTDKPIVTPSISMSRLQVRLSCRIRKAWLSQWCWGQGSGC